MPGLTDIDHEALEILVLSLSDRTRERLIDLLVNNFHSEAAHLGSLQALTRKPPIVLTRDEIEVGRVNKIRAIKDLRQRYHDNGREIGLREALDAVRAAVD